MHCIHSIPRRIWIAPEENGRGGESPTKARIVDVLLPEELDSIVPAEYVATMYPPQLTREREREKEKDVARKALFKVPP